MNSQTFSKILREELARAKALALRESRALEREVRVDRVKAGDEMLRYGAWQRVARVKRRFEVVSIWFDTSDPFSDGAEFEISDRVRVKRGSPDDAATASDKLRPKLFGEPEVGLAGARRDPAKQRMGRFGMI